MRIKLILCSLLLCFLNACATKAITKPYSEIYEEAQDKNIPMPSAEEERAAFYKSDELNKEKLIAVISQRAKEGNSELIYKIGADDEISISVFDVSELNLTAKVKESGLIDLPLIGTIEAKGMTEAELLKDITKRLKGYVINPQVTMFISTYGSQKVAVVGAVAKPGTYPLKKGSNSVLELISEAGGLNDRAGNILNFVPTEVSGLNAANDVESRARFALNAGDKSKTNNATGIEVYIDTLLGTTGGIPVEIPVKGGDIVIVPEAGKVMVDGEVQKVGAYELGRQMSLLGALAAAGGITPSAKFDEVEIIRDINSDKRAHLIINLEKIATGEASDLKLKNGDIVKVPSDSGKRMKYDTFESITKIINFGVGGSVNLAQ